MKNLLVIAVTLIAALLPHSVLGQMDAVPPPVPQVGPGIPVNPVPLVTGNLLGIPGWNSPTWLGSTRPAYADEMWRFAASVAPGHQWINMGFDFPFSAGDTLNFESINLKLNSEPFWVGFVGAELQPVQHWILYGRMGGNIPRDTEMVMEGTGRAFFPANPEDPALDSPPNLTPPWIWTAHNFHWWLMEAGVLRSVTSTVAVEVGFRVEHFDFQLRDPRNYTTPIPGAPGGDRPVTRAIICPRI